MKDGENSRKVALVTNGAEGFFLETEHNLWLREYEWQESQQKDTIGLLIAIAASYLRYGGEEIQMRDGRRELRLSVRDQQFVFRS